MFSCDIFGCTVPASTNIVDTINCVSGISGITGLASAVPLITDITPASSTTITSNLLYVTSESSNVTCVARAVLLPLKK